MNLFSSLADLIEKALGEDTPDLPPPPEVLQALGEPLYLMDVNPTAENIAKLIFDFTADHGFPIVQCELWETPRCVAMYTGSDRPKERDRLSGERAKK